MKRHDKHRGKGIGSREVLDYCSAWCIRPTKNFTSFYFVHQGVKYRVSNHEATPNALDGDMLTIYAEEPIKELAKIHQAIIRGEYETKAA